jgi:hypothetical protein
LTDSVFRVIIEEILNQEADMIKKTVVLFIIVLCSIASAQLAGIKTVGAGGDYSTLTLALHAWKTSTISGNVTFCLLDSVYVSETFPLVCSMPVGYTGGDWTLTIKPASGMISKFEGSNATTIFDLVGIDRLIIDSLIIANRNEDMDTAGHAVRFINGASFNTIKNCKLLAACKLFSSLYGGVVYIASAEAPSGPGNNDNLIENCIVTSSRTDKYPVYGITIRGTSPMWTRTNNNNTIKDCKIYDFSSIGVYFSAYDSNTTVHGNEFYSTVAHNTLLMTGIRMSATSVANTKITSNKFFNFRAVDACTAFQAIYITMARAMNPPLVANNFISLDASVTHPNTKIYGIRLLRQETTPGTYMFYYNSIYIGGTPTSRSSYGFFCKPSATAQTKIDFRNNIIFNNRSGGSGQHYCIYDSLASTNSFISDYNDLYIATPGANGQYVAHRAGMNLATLTDWQNTSYRDSHSISLNPDFMGTVDLHINPASSNVNNLATPISYVTADIDAEARHATIPDIGADEYTPGVGYEEPSSKNLIINLQKIYPNPFKNQTAVRYQINKSIPVCIKIYSCLGGEVKTLIDEQQNSGVYRVNWDGKDNHGQKVTNGIYIYQFKAGNEMQKGQVILIQ